MVQLGDILATIEETCRRMGDGPGATQVREGHLLDELQHLHAQVVEAFGVGGVAVTEALLG